MKIYTSRYSNPALKSDKYVNIRITVGKPRMPVRIDEEIPELYPGGSLFTMKENEEFIKQYTAKKLDSKGIDFFKDLFSRIREKYPDREFVLLCFEDLRKPGEHCHRRVFAEWWKNKTGEEIPELKETAGS